MFLKVDFLQIQKCLKNLAIFSKPDFLSVFVLLSLSKLTRDLL